MSTPDNLPQSEVDYGTRKFIRDGKDALDSSGITLAIFALGYGALTFIFGDELWTSGTVYNTALSVPGAPQTWGAVAILASALMFARYTGIKSLQLRLTCQLVGASIQSIWCAFFAWTFLIDTIEYGRPVGSTGVLIFTIFMVLYAIRIVFTFKHMRNPIVKRGELKW